MKYVIEWHPRGGGVAAENLASTKRSLDVLAKWTPGGTMLQFVNRIDGGGGFAVVESDDPAVVALGAERGQYRELPDAVKCARGIGLVG